MYAAILLTLSNIFMTLAWYGHLKFKGSPLWLAILASWGIAWSRWNCREEQSFPRIQRVRRSGWRPHVLGYSRRKNSSN